MGSNPKGFIYVAEAAKILRCSEARVEIFVKQGCLKWQIFGTDLMVDGEDVATIARLNVADEMDSSEMAHELHMLRAKVERLESSVNVLFQVNHLASDRMSEMETGELMQLHHAVVKDTEEDQWPTERLLSYCEVFIRLAEEDIDRLNRVLGEQHSWVPFYKLLIKVARFVGSQEDLHTNLQLQRIRELLEAGRSNLRSIAVFFVHATGDHEPSKELLSELVSNDIDMFDDMARQLKMKNSGYLVPV